MDDEPLWYVAYGSNLFRERFRCYLMHRPVGADHDLSEAVRHGRQRIGPGRYETVLKVGERAGRPMLTFTSPEPAPPNAPTAPYLTMLGGGLREAHDWSAERAASYLAGRPGARGAWTPDGIAGLLRPGSPRPGRLGSSHERR